MPFLGGVSISVVKHYFWCTLLGYTFFEEKTVNKLDAVNLLIEAAGGDTVSLLTTPLPDVASAIRHLNLKSRSEQAKGWWFNTDWNVTYQPQDNGEILVPSEISRLVMDDTTLIARNKKLYDTINQTYQFTENKVCYQQIRILEWDEMDELMQTYCLYKAAVEFTRIAIGNPALEQSFGRDAGLALIDLKSQQMLMSRHNMYNTSKVRAGRMGVSPYGNKSGGPLQDTLKQLSGGINAG